MTVRPQDVVLLPHEAATLGQVREAIGLDRLAAENPDHEVFALAWKFPGNPVAVAFRVRKDVVHIQGVGLPIWVDPDSRLAVITPVAQLPRGSG